VYAELFVMKRILMLGLGGILGAVAIAYAIDRVRVTFPGGRQLYEDVRVDQVYTSTNKWKQVDWSRGNPIVERCVYALFPQEGYRPCWYVKSHTMTITNTD